MVNISCARPAGLGGGPARQHMPEALPTTAAWRPERRQL